MKYIEYILRYLLCTSVCVIFMISSALAGTPDSVPLARKITSETNGLIRSGAARTAEITFPWLSAPNAAVRTMRIKFFYTEKTQMNANGFPEAVNTLCKAVVKHEFTAGKPIETDEYYFYKGALLFVFMKGTIAEEGLNERFEYRYYFDGGMLARSTEMSQPTGDTKERRITLDGAYPDDTKMRANTALRHAKELLQIFNTLNSLKK